MGGCVGGRGGDMDGGGGGGGGGRGGGGGGGGVGCQPDTFAHLCLEGYQTLKVIQPSRVPNSSKNGNPLL